MSTRARKERKRERQWLLGHARYEGDTELGRMAEAEAEALRFVKPPKVGTPLSQRARYRDPAAEVDAALQHGARMARVLAPFVGWRR